MLDHRVNEIKKKHAYLNARKFKFSKNLTTSNYAYAHTE